MDRLAPAAGLGNMESSSETRGTCAILSQMNGTSVQINVIFCIRAATEEYLNVIHAGSTLQVTSHCPDRTALLPLGCQFLHHRKGQGFTISHLHGKLGRHKISA